MKPNRRLSRSSEKDNNNYLRVFTVVVLGDSQVGKSALVGRFLEREFEGRHEPTVENFHVKCVSYKDRPFELQIIDTSGTYEFPAMRQVAILKADGVMLVYSRDQENSLDRMERYMAEVREYRKGNPVPMVVVSNKSDQPCQFEEQRMRDERGLFVSTEVYLENKWGCPCLQASAKTNDNVEDAFMKLLSLLSEREARVAKEQLATRLSASQLLQPLRRLRASKEPKRNSFSCVRGMP